MPDRQDLNALLGSRICHDLISPIGAIGNGVELLIMDGTHKGPEIALIAESVANANARIRFFRIAFGASATDQRIGRAEVQNILADLTRGGRLTVDWNGPADLPRREVKLVFLMFMCLETAMAYGGHVGIDQEGERWVLTGTAAKLRAVPDLWAMLTDPANALPVTASQVHFALAPEELARQDRLAALDITETGIRLTC